MLADTNARKPGATGGDVEPERITRICEVFASETRVRIIQLLRQHPLCVNALAARLEVTHSAVSQHLRVLRNAGLVFGEKRGYWVHYEVNEDELEQCAEALAEFLSR